MPYCPNCKMEFVKGVTACTDCGDPLVDDEEKERQFIEQEAKESERTFRRGIISFVTLICGWFFISILPTAISYRILISIEHVRMGILVVIYISIIAGMLLFLLSCKILYSIFVPAKKECQNHCEDQRIITQGTRFNLYAAIFGSLWLAYRKKPIACGIFFVLQSMCKRAVFMILFTLIRSALISGDLMYIILDLGTGFVIILFHLLLGFWAKQMKGGQEKAVSLAVSAAFIIAFADMMLNQHVYERLIYLLL